MTTSTESSELFQIPIEAAEFYESAFVPAFFAQWAPILCAVAGVGPGQRLLDELTGLVESAGLRVTSARTHVGVYRAPSVDAFVTTEVESTPLIERISDEAYRRIRTDARDVLAPSTTAGGSIEAPFPCHVLLAQQP